MSLMRFSFWTTSVRKTEQLVPNTWFILPLCVWHTKCCQITWLQTLIHERSVTSSWNNAGGWTFYWDSISHQPPVSLYLCWETVIRTPIQLCWVVWPHHWSWRTSSGPGRSSAPRWDTETHRAPSTWSSSERCRCYRDPGRIRTYRNSQCEVTLTNTQVSHASIFSLLVFHNVHLLPIPTLFIKHF